MSNYVYLLKLEECSNSDYKTTLIKAFESKIEAIRASNILTKTSKNLSDSLYLVERVDFVSEKEEQRY